MTCPSCANNVQALYLIDGRGNICCGCKAADAVGLKIGQKVSFTIIRSRGEGFNISSRVGTLTGAQLGGVGIVRYKGRIYVRDLTELRAEDKPSALTEAFQKTEAA